MACSHPPNPHQLLPQIHTTLLIIFASQHINTLLKSYKFHWGKDNLSSHLFPLSKEARPISLKRTTEEPLQNHEWCSEKQKLKDDTARRMLNLSLFLRSSWCVTVQQWGLWKNKTCSCLHVTHRPGMSNSSGLEKAKHLASDLLGSQSRWHQRCHPIGSTGSQQTASQDSVL